MIDIIFTALFEAATTTTVSIDWGVIAASLAPIITIIVTWYLQRKTTRAEADKVAQAAKDTAASLAKSHEQDKQEAIAHREQDTTAILSGQQDIAAAVNTQLMLLANARIKSLQEKIVAAGGPPNGVPPTTLENASDIIDTLEKRLDRLTAAAETK
jgi:hypothetical protein